jgi:Phospholipase_D-nuclease N-terminal
MYMPHYYAPFALIAMIFWVWMIVDCVRNSRLQGGVKVAWLLVIIFANWVGALIYFFAGRMRNQAPRSQWYGRPNQQSNQPPVYYQPNQPQTYYQPPTSEPYREYQQGYGVAPIERKQQASDATSWQQYEEPQSLYPQIPQQELPPQEQQ